MKKEEFLSALSTHLAPLSEADRADILADFEEHFASAAECGKSEEQICAELGNPYTCALQYLRTEPKRAEPQKEPAPVLPTQNNQAGIPKAEPRHIDIAWTVLFVLLVLFAFGLYPASIGLMVSPILIAIAAVFLFAAVPSGAMLGFLISASVFLFVSGLFLLLALTAGLKYTYKRTNI